MATNSDSVVLSKTKTKLQKLQDEEDEMEAKLRRKRSERRRTKLSCMFVPTLGGGDVKQIENERDLRRKATRGVVALFNAIQTFQHDAKAKEKNGEGSGKENGGAVGKKQKKAEFLSLIKEKAAVPNATKTVQPMSEKRQTKHDSSDESDADDSDKNTKSKWLRDDFMTSKASKLKDWDKSDSSSDEAEDDNGYGDSDGDLSDAEAADAKAAREHERKMRYGRNIEIEEKKKKRTSKGGGGGGKKKSKR